METLKNTYKMIFMLLLLYSRFTWIHKHGLNVLIHDLLHYFMYWTICAFLCGLELFVSFGLFKPCTLASLVGFEWKNCHFPTCLFIPILGFFIMTSSFSLFFSVSLMSLLSSFLYVVF